MRGSLALSIADPSQVGEARRSAIAIALRLGFNETDRGKVGLVVTEAANNLLKHAKEGVLLLQEISQGDRVGVEILAIDKGPGMAEIDRCLSDGYSTAGTSGHGLGTIQRISSVFDIYSRPEIGTALLAQLWAGQPSSLPSFETGAICLPKRGEEVSGDAWATKIMPQRSLFLVADGLGHGPSAAQASAEAVRSFIQNCDRPLPAIFEAAHDALRSTRGAALAIAEVNPEQEALRFVGVGNISGDILSFSGNHSLMSHNGTVGHEVRKIQEFTHAWPSDGLLILHSDGLGTQWRLDRYPGLRQKHPSLIASVLYRDFNRGRDDVTVLVARSTAY